MTDKGFVVRKTNIYKHGHGRSSCEHSNVLTGGGEEEEAVVGMGMS